MNQRASFTRMDHSSQQDGSCIVPEAMKMAKTLPDRVLDHLRRLMAQPRQSIYKAAMATTTRPG